MTPSGIEPETFWFEAQHLNHCATAVPLQSITIRTICFISPKFYILSTWFLFCPRDSNYAFHIRIDKWSLYCKRRVFFEEILNLNFRSSETSCRIDWLTTADISEQLVASVWSVFQDRRGTEIFRIFKGLKRQTQFTVNKPGIFWLIQEIKMQGFPC